MDEEEEIQAEEGATAGTVNVAGLSPLATAAGIATVNPHLDVTSILTSHLARTEAAAHRTTNPDPLHTPHVAAAQTTADRHRPIEAAERGDAVRTTVIETEPIIEMIHPAHVLPDEIKETSTA